MQRVKSALIICSYSGWVATGKLILPRVVGQIIVYLVASTVGGGVGGDGGWWAVVVIDI